MLRHRWQRTIPILSPHADVVTAMVAAGLPGARVVRFETIVGGLANTNIRIDLADAPHHLLLRLYQRDPAVAEKEATIAERLAGLVPVPRTLHLGTHEGQRFALVAWMEGLPLGAALDDTEARETLGRAAGAALAKIHSVRFETAGFVDSALNVITPVIVDRAWLLHFLRLSLIDGGGARYVPRDLADAVLDYANVHGDERWGDTFCLTHCDYNGSNILVKDGRISAVLDWEFAFSGTPAADFGNLMRNHPEADFQNAVARGYAGAGGFLPEHWRRLARTADLASWADFLSRPQVDAAIVEDALAALRATVSGGD